MKKFICAIIALGCTTIILGVVGASDLDEMSVREMLKWLAIAVPGLLISLKIGGLFK